MGCGISMSESQINKQSISPKKQQNAQHNQPIKEEQTKKESPSTNLELKSKPIQNSEIQSICQQIRQQNSTKAIQKSKSEQNFILSFQSLPSIKEGKIFLFGQSADQRKIVSLDLNQLKFQTVASRSTKIQHNKKYQPNEIIFEESQQLQASHLYNKYSHPPYNFMFATYLSDQKIFLCGGITARFEYVSDQSFIYSINKNQKISVSEFSKIENQNNLIGLNFQKLEHMNDKRYSHMGVLFPMGKIAYVFVFGGRGQDQEALKLCEKYSIYQKKWISIAPMNIARSTGLSLIFKSKIYVFGGYASDKKRAKKIQVYDPVKDYWQILDVKLHRGIEAGTIFSTRPNEFLILGGIVELGPLKSVIKVNLVQKTYQWDSNMKSDRFLHKGGKFNDQIFVFGGDFQNTFQRYTLKDRKWRDQQVSYERFISPDQINSFTLASQTIEVKYDESLIWKPDSVNDFERIYIFGNDQFPCILQINLNKWVLKKKSVPMALRLKCQMAVTKVKDGKYLIVGGIDSFHEKCSRAAYLYYAGTNKAIQVQKINQKKYQMASCTYENTVYLFGGRSGFNGQILSVCEKFDLSQQKWKPLSNLSRQRAKAKTLIYKEQIFLWGGSDSLQNLTQIQIFNPKTQTFSLFSKSLPIASEIRCVTFSPQPQSSQIIIFSYNDLLNEEHCHSCLLRDEENTVKQQQKSEQSGLVDSSDLKLTDIPVTLPAFSSIFQSGENFYFITNKGVQTWIYNKKDDINTLKPQIIINQVQMLQFPIAKFSFIEY